MQTIGERLEESRKRKGISIREAAEATKIRGDYLQKFESNSFDVDLPPLYVRGFLRGYARYLALDPERLVQEYDTLLSDQGRTSRREPRESYGRVEIGAAGAADSAVPATTARPPVGQVDVVKYLLIGITAVVVVGITVFLVVKLLSSPASQPRNPTRETPAATAKTDAEHILTITFAGPTRVKVVRLSDGNLLLDGLAEVPAGQSRVFRFRDRLKVTVADPKNIRMEIDGQPTKVPIDEWGFFYVDPS
jgi:transcriptional regulator with XRE-family HTH domain